MQTKRYTIEKKLLDFHVKDEYEYEDLFFGNEEDSDNDFMQVLEGYDYSKYPKKTKKSRPAAKEPKKPKFESGKYYKVKYQTYTEEKEILGEYDSTFAKTHTFRLFGKPAFSDTEFIEDDDIKSFKEVFPTDKTKMLIDGFEQVENELSTIEEEMSRLRSEFYSLYSAVSESWKKRTLKTVDIGESYPGVEKLEIGSTYLVKVKNNNPLDRKIKGIDAVLVINYYENAIGEHVRVMGCDPNLYASEIVSIMPVIASNIDEFTEEILPDAKGFEIQKKRLELYNKKTDLSAKRKQIIDDYQKSFAE